MLLMLLLLIITSVMFILVACMRPARLQISQFERERRTTSGTQTVSAELRRDELIADVLTLQRIVTMLLLIAVTVFATMRFGVGFGALVAVGLVLIYGVVARLQIVARLASKLYARSEPTLLDLVEKYPRLFRVLDQSLPTEHSDIAPESREELIHTIKRSRGIITASEVSLLASGLQFADKSVSDIMTPRTAIDSIERNELLGPLVLDDLHKTGHSRFPVIDKDIDHVVGILYAQDLLSLDVKRSITAGKAMDAHVYYIHERQSLQHALTAFLRTHHHLFIVVNEFQETVGLLSLEDTLESLIGRKIVDEFDAHGDLRAVAKRNPKGNNQPAKRSNI